MSKIDLKHWAEYESPQLIVLFVEDARIICASTDYTSSLEDVTPYDPWSE